MDNVDNIEQTIRELKFDDNGLIPAICVDADNKQVLMLAYMNAASAIKTVKTGKTHFWSRSRKKYWMKGESSGHVQDVRAIYVDCDKDTLLIEVAQHGGACHEGYRSCFFRKLDDRGRLEIIAEKVFDPEQIYKTGQ